MMPAVDYVLALLAAADDIPSRTMLQKLVYLSADLADEPLPFSAHFYGPYSSDLQEDVEALVAGGLVTETVSRLEPWEPTPFDVVQYRYGLTDAGRDAAALVPGETRDQAERVVQAARAAHAWNQASLSLAAKLRHLRRIDPSLGDDQVPALAHQFGWRMTEESARRGARLLEALDARG
jgi:uncharacterized protein YwgA